MPQGYDERKRAYMLAYYHRRIATDPVKMARKNELNKRARRQLKVLDPEKAARQVRGWNFKKKYGITIETYEAMYAEQGGLCAICRGMQIAPWRFLAVDHDHATGAVRKLLCTPCNATLGMVRDSRDRLRAMIAYLDECEAAAAKPDENLIPFPKAAEGESGGTTQ